MAIYDSLSIRAMVAGLESAIEANDFKKADQVATGLIAIGRDAIARHLLGAGDFKPVDLMRRLNLAVNLPALQEHSEVKRVIACAAKQFTELACMRNTIIDDPTQAEIRNALNTSIEHSMAILKQENVSPQDHVALVHELECCSEALKRMESPKIKEGLIAGIKASLTMAHEEILDLGDLIGDLQEQKGKSWFLTVLFLNWMGPFARNDEAHFCSILASVKPDSPETAQALAVFLTDIILHGSPLLQKRALVGTEKGDTCLLTLAGIKKHNTTLWPVRYRVIQLVSDIAANHTDPAITTEALSILFQRISEEDKPQVQKLIRERFQPLFARMKLEHLLQNINVATAQNLMVLAEQRALGLDGKLQDLDTAIKYFEACATKGDNGQAQYYMGILSDPDKTEVQAMLKADNKQDNLSEITGLLIECPSKREESTAKEWYAKAAKKGVVYASCRLGDINHSKAWKIINAQQTRNGATAAHQQIKKAMDHYHAAASAGAMRAVFQISLHATSGMSRQMHYMSLHNLHPLLTAFKNIFNKNIYKRTNAEAVKNTLSEWINLAARAGRIETPALIAGTGEVAVEMVDRPNHDALIESICQNTCLNTPENQYLMGWFYDETRGMDVDLRQYLFMQSRKNDASSTLFVTLLALFTHEESYSERDNKKAIEHYRLSADAGYAPAQCRLGFLEEQAGLSATNLQPQVHFNQARSLYQKAAEQGHAAATYHLGRIYGQGIVVKQSFSKAIQYHRQAASLGQPHAQFSLGACYELGRGVVFNVKFPDRARHHYETATKQGLIQASLHNLILDPKKRLANADDWLMNHRPNLI